MGLMFTSEVSRAVEGCCPSAGRFGCWAEFNRIPEVGRRGVVVSIALSDRGNPPKCVNQAGNDEERRDNDAVSAPAKIESPC